jgi:hypothetical protein
MVRVLQMIERYEFSRDLAQQGRRLLRALGLSRWPISVLSTTAIA